MGKDKCAFDFIEVKTISIFTFPCRVSGRHLSTDFSAWVGACVYLKMKRVSANSHQNSRQQSQVFTK